MKRIGIRGALLILALSLFVGIGSAAQVSDTLSVSANVPVVCSLSTSPVNFGNYSGNDTYASGSVHVTCNIGISYTVSLSTGNSGTYSPRTLLDWGWLAATLNYNLYTSAAYTTIWGDASGVTGVISDTGTGSAQTHTVYGWLPAGQAAQFNDTYSDSVTVTVTY